MSGDNNVFSVKNKMQDLKLSMYDILGDTEAFDLFMNHLVREFAVENLLFICELMQFKISLQHKILRPNSALNDTETGINDIEMTTVFDQKHSALFIIKLPWEIIPSSSILKYSNGNSGIAARKIYNKYIKDGNNIRFDIIDRDHLQINISSKCRHELDDFFGLMYPNCGIIDSESTIDTKDENMTPLNDSFEMPSDLDLFSVFDHARDEILSVLRQSYLRFLNSNQYKDIEAKLMHNKTRKHVKTKSTSLRAVLEGVKKNLSKRSLFGRDHSKTKSKTQDIGLVKPDYNDQYNINTNNNDNSDEASVSNHEIINTKLKINDDDVKFNRIPSVTPTPQCHGIIDE